MNVTKERRGSASSELPEAAQEETLPLYQEFQLQDPDTDRDTIPPLTATPAEVRDYLASLLRKRHSLSDDQVRRVVARWTLASGRELRIYTAQMYLDIFGSECGWTLYRDVKLELYRTTPNSFAQDGRIYKHTAGAWVFACLLVISLLVFHDKARKTMITLMLIFSGPVIVATFVGIVGCAVEYFSPDTPPQTWIEQELQRCTRNRPTLST